MANIKFGRIFHYILPKAERGSLLLPSRILSFSSPPCQPADPFLHYSHRDSTTATTSMSLLPITPSVFMDFIPAPTRSTLSSPAFPSRTSQPLFHPPNLNHPTSTHFLISVGDCLTARGDVSKLNNRVRIAEHGHCSFKKAERIIPKSVLVPVFPSVQSVRL